MNSCLNCGKETRSKFCSHSCSAQVSNKNRPSRAKPKEVKILKERKLSSRTCSTCSLVEYSKGTFRSSQCKFCSSGMIYRYDCRFIFNLKDYPEEFDFELLTTHGMFNPKNNPKGVSRDHIYSVEDGKNNKISSKILSHPANCKLMLQGDNTRKQGKSDITLEELLIKIEIWNRKYLGVPLP